MNTVYPLRDWNRILTIWGIHFDIAGTKSEIAELEAKASEPDFWNDMENSGIILQKTKMLKDKVERFEALSSSREDLLVLIEMAEEENDPSYAG